MQRKFLVINHKHIDKLPINIKERFIEVLEIANHYIPENSYYVCNQDEPYAEQVLDIILAGEDAKN